jgi:hypothetical protein
LVSCAKKIWQPCSQSWLIAASAVIVSISDVSNFLDANWRSGYKEPLSDFDKLPGLPDWNYFKPKPKTICIIFLGPWNGKAWYTYNKAIGNILLPLGILHGHLVLQRQVGIFSVVLVYCVKKNLAALQTSRRLLSQGSMLQKHGWFVLISVTLAGFDLTTKCCWHKPYNYVCRLCHQGAVLKEARRQQEILPLANVGISSVGAWTRVGA